MICFACELSKQSLCLHDQLSVLELIRSLISLGYYTILYTPFVNVVKDLIKGQNLLISDSKKHYSPVFHFTLPIHTN